MAIFETALARGPGFLLGRARALGVDDEDLLREAGIRPDQLADPDSRLPIAKLAGLWRALLERLPERDLGVRLGRAFDIRDSGLVGYLGLNSATLWVALERVVRFSRILNEAVRPRLAEEAGRGILSWAPSPFFRPYPQATDWGLAALLTCLRQATGSSFEPVEVWFPYPRPRRLPEAHRGHFRGVLRFDRDRVGLVLSRQQLTLPVQGADTELGTYLERHADEVLRGLSSQGDLVARVRATVWESLREGRPSIGRTARSLGMSSRSLQRRLRVQGTSFGALRDEMLRLLATSLLRDRSLAIHEISFLLGYSEPSTFYRAFRRWERVSPARFRAAG